VGYVSSNLEAEAGKFVTGQIDMNELFDYMDKNNLLKKSTTRSTNIGENLRINYRNDLLEVGVNGGMNYQHARNDDNTRANMDSWNFNYGGDMTITAPWGTTLRTDIGPRYRRGYADESMNTTELIWNASLQHAFLKKKNLIVSAHWYDILGERSNISRSISATMRSDTQTNAIYSYVMFKVSYKLNLLGGQNSHSGRGPGFFGGGHGRAMRMW
jgi:hypothetical protein